MAPRDDAPDRQEFDLLIVPKPRQTAADRWRKRPSVLRYRAFADELRLRAKGLPLRFIALADLPMPLSWSAAKRQAMEGQPHQVRPDFDNLIKALTDALCPRDDAHLYDGRRIKRWARHPRLVIERCRDNRPWEP